MQLEKAKALAEGLMLEYGIAPEWRFRFDRSKVRHGQARAVTLRGRAVKEITISKWITELSSEDKVKDTVLHEIAHVLVGLEHDHDEVWEAKANSMGVVTDFKHDDVSVVEQLAPYKYYCSVDQEMIFSSHKPYSVSKMCCPAHPNETIIRLHEGYPDLIIKER